MFSIYNQEVILWERCREEYLPDSLTSTNIPIYIYKLIFSTDILWQKVFRRWWPELDTELGFNDHNRKGNNQNIQMTIFLFEN